MQTTPASEVAQDHAEDVHDFFEEVLADGRIEPDEVAAMRRRLDLVVHHTDRANLDRAIGVCLIRGGFGGDRHLRLIKERATLDQLAPCHCEPLDAA